MYLGYTSYGLRIHYTQIDILTLDLDIDIMALEEGILCVPGIHIILSQSIQHTKI